VNPVVVRSKAKFCDVSIAGIAGANTNESIDVCVLCLLCVVLASCVCNELMTCSEESYRVWCVCVCVCVCV